jgi:NADPH-dependent 2,4-dienoyl-CoA reductase/sulfur reductase-like enzyme/rhodanese-related sulfurtransferase
VSRSKRVVIVGGVAAGMSAACRYRRLDENAEIVVLERGPDVSFANCGLPYHIAGTIRDRATLILQTPQELAARYALDVRVRHEVMAIDRGAHEIVIEDHQSNSEYRLAYDALLLCPGASAARPPIPGADHPRALTLRTLEDMDAILAAAQTCKSQRAVVVGAGYIGIETAEALCFAGLEVAVVEALPQLLSAVDPEMAVLCNRELERNGVDLFLGTTVAAIRPAGDELEVALSSGASLPCGVVILATGVRPETRLAREADLALGPTGGILVDESMRTSDPAIWAAGDATEVMDLVSGAPALLPLAGPANRQGRTAADAIAGRYVAYRGSQGTAICKVFELTVASTGLNEKTLRQRSAPYEKVYVHGGDHASYYPGATPVHLKLLFDPRDGRILGAQAVGAKGVDKRIDVLAVALRGGMTVFDLEHLELCYAPPYGSAKDPINMAGFVAANALRGDVLLASVDDVIAPRLDQLLLDVRTAEEVAKEPMPQSTCIPLDELRQRLGELPSDKEILVVCAVGQRGYVACRLLSQHGFRCRNLSGGATRHRLFREAAAAARGAHQHGGSA